MLLSLFLMSEFQLPEQLRWSLVMKLKIEEASEETYWRMILALSYAALDWMLSMSLCSTVLQVLVLTEPCDANIASLCLSGA